MVFLGEQIFAGIGMECKPEEPYIFMVQYNHFAVIVILLLRCHYFRYLENH